MALNPNIILAGQQPDIVNALARSTQAAGMTQQVQQEAKKNAFLGQNGAALMAGDQQALSSFARFDPVNATNMLAKRQDMTIRAQANERDASAQSAQMLAIVNKMSAAEAAQELAATEAAMRQATTYFLQGNLAGVNSVLSAEGIGELQSLDQYEAIALGFKDATEMLKAKAEMDKPLSDAGKTQADINRGRLPPGTPLRASGANVTVNNNAPVDDSEALKVLDKAQGAAFGALLENGQNAPVKMAQIDQLETLLSNQTTPQGMEAALKSWLGNYGVDIDTEGLSNLQAAQAIINQLVPAQRTPGSGPMSDADLAVFKQSLPRLINTREGNNMIINTLRGIQLYSIKQAEIANAVANREITMAEGRKQLMALENPLEVFPKPRDTSITGYTIEDVK